MQLARLEVEAHQRRAEELAHWILDASNPYMSWVFGGPARALEVVRKWCARKTSELSLERLVALVEEEDVIGGFIAMNGRELAQCRKSDLLWLARETHDEERGSVLKRLEQARDVFPSVEASHCYLSRMFLDPSYRGKGLGKWLMKCVMGHPELQNLRRWILATRDAHGLYEKYGFTILKSPQVFMERHDPDVYRRPRDGEAQ
jgi:GNAT superfamily N-acetyltransferase